MAAVRIAGRVVMAQPAPPLPPESRQTPPAAIRREDRVRANHRLLDSLAALWDEIPDQRFGQLVMNLSREPGGFADIWEWGHGTWFERIQTYYGDLRRAKSHG